MIDATNAYTLDFLPETFSKIQKRVEEQKVQDKENGYKAENEFNSQGEAICIDGSCAAYSKSYTDEETGKTAIVSYTYEDTDSNGTYDKYCNSTFYGTADMMEKLLKDGQIFQADGMVLYDTDDNGEFDTLSVQADDYGLNWNTYTRESEDSNTFKRGFMEKAKDFFSSIGDFFKSCWESLF